MELFSLLTNIPLDPSEGHQVLGKLQYQNLTPDEKSDIEHRLAEIALSIAKINYAEEQAKYSNLLGNVLGNTIRRSNDVRLVKCWSPAL